MGRFAVVVDVDGTIAIRGERSPYDWHRVGEDTPNEPIVRLVQQLALTCEVIYVSGRDERGRDDTSQWIFERVGVEGPLFMRGRDDNRPDAEVKKSIYLNEIKPGFDVWLVLDDRNQTVAMWREIGLTCLQVANGDF
jgi:hypothetical protein